MTRRYNSFLIRCWRLEGETRRIEVEHIQSGQRLRTASPEAARAWLEQRSREWQGDGQELADVDCDEQDRAGFA